MRIPVILLVAGLVLASCEPPSGSGTAESPLRTQGQAIDCSGTGPNPPRVTLTSPAAGAVLSGTVTLSADAADDDRVTGVHFYIDGQWLVSDTTPPFELVWDSTTHGNGPAVFTALAQDSRCQSTTSAPVEVTLENAGIAAYDATWGAPACAAVGSKCDSANLLEGRGGLGELHQPNTVGSSCPDGSNGVGGPTAAVQRLAVSRGDGTPLTAGKEVTVQATVQATATYGYQALDLYVAPDASNPTWTFVDTLFPPTATGLWTLSTTYLLPVGGRHILRGVYRSNGRQTPPVPCIPLNFDGNFSDHDDLVIAVGEETDSAPPAVAITFPAEGATLDRVVTVTVAASDNFGVHRVELYDGTTLVASAARAPYALSWATRTAPNGLHTLTARAYDLAGNVTTSAPVNVLLDNDFVAPQVAFITPVDGATVEGTLPLEVSATDDRGTVRVEFHVDGRLLETRYAPPYTVSWNSRQGQTDGVSNGPHVLSATGYDLGGNASPPSIVNVVVNNDYTAPSESTLTSPSSGALLSGLVTLEATASDDRGIAAVAFYVDNLLIGTDTTAPYSLSWDSAEVSNGSHQLKALARDSGGNSRFSAGITVQTSNAGNVRFDSSLRVPRCDSATARCDSRELLLGRGSQERNTPNTLDGCVDGNSFDWSHMREAVERIRVIREDGTALAAGKRVRVEVDVRAGYIPADTLDLYHSANAAPGGPFTKFAALHPTEGAGPYQTLSAEFVLPAGNLQAIRARMQSNVDLYHPQCRAEDDFTDRDDLVFAVTQETDTVPPHRAVLTAPANGAVVTGSVLLTAEASDDFGVAAVDFHDGETLIGTDTTEPFSVSWNSKKGPNGSRTLTARARDLAGNVSSSAPVTVTASNDLSVPMVTLTSPAAGSRLTRHVEFAAEATDPEGVIRVDFYSGERLIGSDSSAPYSCTCDTGITGTSRSSLTARAHDASGNVGVSAPVVVTVAPEVSPPSVSLTAPGGGEWLVGTVTLAANASDSSGVSKVEFLLDGTQVLGTVNSAPYRYTWNSTTAASGGHTLSVRATDSHGNTGTSTEVAVTVDNLAPTVALTAPAQNAFVQGTVLVSATASDNLGVARVEFYADGVLMGTDTSAPYEVSWNSAALADGVRLLNAKAYDSAGNVTSTPSIVVNTDNTLPAAALTSPAPGAFLRGTTVLTATASDSGGVARVEFHDGAILIGTDSVSPYEVGWNTAGATNGAHTLTVKAFDSAGNVRTSAGIGVTVDNAAPVTALSTPAQNASVRGIVTVTATASDDQGVARVEFYASGTLLGTVTTAPYGVSWDTTAVATGSVITLTTRAYDAAGNVTVSAGRTVTVDPTAPGVAITSPANGTSFSFLTLSTTLQATASDNVGVTQVVFYDGASVIGSDTTAPYSVSWNLLNASKGTHTLTARAHDAAGNVTTSAPISVRVN